MGKFFASRHSRKRLLFDWLLIALMAMLAYFVAQAYRGSNISGNARVVDGDTIGINAMRIRLSGMDAPEQSQTCEGINGQVSCGMMATRYLRSIIGNKTVVCRGWQYDVYDRLLAVCTTAGNHPDGPSLNEQMVGAGFAVSYGDYTNQQLSAKRAGKGIWSTEFTRPEEWRRKAREEGGPEVAIIRSSWNWARRLLPVENQ